MNAAEPQVKKGESGPTQTVVEGERWDAKPKLALAVGGAIRIIPVLVGTIAVWIATKALPRPHGWWIAAWWAGLIVLAQGTVWLLNKWFARLLPMSMLLRLSLAFPDQAPSRVSTALRSGNVEKLNREVQQAVEKGLPVEINEAIRTALAMVRELNSHDKGTRGHSERVRAYSEVIAEEMGLSVQQREQVRWGALLHDMGKLTVPSAILNKAGRPTEAEWTILRNHPLEGARILAPLADWLGDGFHACDHHHERWDGKGYPYGLGENNISLTGRIVAVADAFAVMTMARSYKKPYPIEVARRELLKGAGSQFDPNVVRAMLAVSVGRINKLAGPVAALANIPLIGPLLGPLAAPLASAAPAIPSAIRAGAAAFMATGAAVAPMAQTPLPWEADPVPAIVATPTPPTVTTAPDELAFADSEIAAIEAEPTTTIRAQTDIEAQRALRSSNTSTTVIFTGSTIAGAVPGTPSSTQATSERPANDSGSTTVPGLNSAAQASESGGQSPSTLAPPGQLISSTTAATPTAPTPTRAPASTTTTTYAFGTKPSGPPTAPPTTSPTTTTTLNPKRTTTTVATTTPPPVETTPPIIPATSTTSAPATKPVPTVAPPITIGPTKPTTTTLLPPAPTTSPPADTIPPTTIDPTIPAPGTKPPATTTTITPPPPPPGSPGVKTTIVPTPYVTVTTFPSS
jgi:putative nucleotidyltransferase with HDIG domain